MYLTHYSVVGRDAADVERLAALLVAQIDEMEAIALRLKDAPGRHVALKRELLALYQRRAIEHCGDRMPPTRVAALLAMDVELNAQGLSVWLDKRSRQ